MRSRISGRNSTEPTKLASDHLLTAPSLSLRTFLLIIHNERRGWKVVDFILTLGRKFLVFILILHLGILLVKVKTRRKNKTKAALFTRAMVGWSSGTSERFEVMASRGIADTRSCAR